MSIREGFNLYYRNFGFRGLAAIASYRLIGLPTRIRIRCPEAIHPVYLRMGTTDASLYRSVLRLKEYEFDLRFSPETIVDAGANIGMASVFFANKYPSARVIAIEAERSNFEMLCRNCRAYPNVVATHAALWNRDGEIAVTAPDPDSVASGGWGFVTYEGPGPRVRAMTVETVLREFDIKSIDVFKIDIEGSEMEVFANPAWVNKVNCVMIELHDRFKPGCSDVVESAMAGFSRSQRGETVFYIRGAC